MVMNKRGSKFGNLYKLQKKNINDDGIVNVDEGLNYSYEKQKKQKQLRTNDEEPVPDSIGDSLSGKSSGDSDFLKLEYQALKETYQEINAKKSSSPSVHNSLRKSPQNKLKAKQSETLVSRFNLDEQI